MKQEKIKEILILEKMKQMVDLAKSYAKKQHRNWTDVYTEMITWSLVNMINEDKDGNLWLQLKKEFVNEEKNNE